VIKKGDGRSLLDALQPVNAYGSACGIIPKLNELLDGEHACQVLDTATILSMAALELVISQ